MNAQRVAVGWSDWLDLCERFITDVAQEFDAIWIFPVCVAIFDGEPAEGAVLVLPHALDQLKLRCVVWLAMIIFPHPTAVYRLFGKQRWMS